MKLDKYMETKCPSCGYELSVAEGWLYCRRGACHSIKANDGVQIVNGDLKEAMERLTEIIELELESNHEYPC